MSFELKQSLNLKLSQQLVMTPQLQQAIRLLQLSRMELIDAIHAELEQNPVLEEEVRPDRAVLESEAAIAGADPKDVQEPAATPDKVQEVSDGEKPNDIDWQQYIESLNSSAPATGGIRKNDDDLPNIEQTLTESETLFDHLIWQLNTANMVDQDREIAVQIIGGLDDAGFLRGERPLEHIAIRLEVSVDHVERVLGVIQTFDPIGIATRALGVTELSVAYHQAQAGKMTWGVDDQGNSVIDRWGQGDMSSDGAWRDLLQGEAIIDRGAPIQPRRREPAEEQDQESARNAKRKPSAKPNADEEPPPPVTEPFESGPIAALGITVNNNLVFAHVARPDLPALQSAMISAGVVRALRVNHIGTAQTGEAQFFYNHSGQTFYNVYPDLALKPAFLAIEIITWILRASNFRSSILSSRRIRRRYPIWSAPSEIVKPFLSPTRSG